MNSTTLPRRWLIAYALLAFAVPLVYALYTQHVWEDFFITFRHSQNLVEGAGLVFEPGQRVHGFTSPLGVLLPALCHAVTGATSSYEPALWLFRVLSALAFSAACLLFVSLPTPAPRRHVAVLAGLLLLFEIKAVCFTANGMETGFMLLFLALTLRVDPLRWAVLGAAWAGLMWTRPDGFIYVAAYGAVNLALPERDRRQLLVAFLKAAAVCTVLYLPWFAGAWIYYGSPVPHPAQAKSLGYFQPFDLLHRLKAIWSASHLLYQPPYAFFGGWPTWIRWPAHALGVLAIGAWALPGLDRTGRRLSLLTLLLAAYVSTARPAPWYLPPAAACGLVVLARLPWLPWRLTLARRSPAQGLRPTARARVGAGLLAGAILAPLVVTSGRATEQLAWQQELIETGNRRQVGLWLREHVAPRRAGVRGVRGVRGLLLRAPPARLPGDRLADRARPAARGRGRLLERDPPPPP